jgi:hypothetical protein
MYSLDSGCLGDRQLIVRTSLHGGGILLQVCGGTICIADIEVSEEELELSVPFRTGISSASRFRFPRITRFAR